MRAEHRQSGARDSVTNSPAHIPVRPEWLATHQEPPLDPMLAVIDSHHHLYDRPGCRYLLDDLLRDLYDGHNVRATVHVQARSMLRAGAPPHLQPLGETEFANGVAAMSASGSPSRMDNRATTRRRYLGRVWCCYTSGRACAGPNAAGRGSVCCRDCH